MKDFLMARFQFKFWLDANKDDELLLAEEIDLLKRQRTYTSTIRDGIRLISDLRAGRLDVLFELFPWVRAEFLDHIQPTQSPAEIEMQHRLERMESLLLAQGNTPISGQGVGKSLLKGLAAPPIDNEDDTDLLVVKKSTVNSAQNFLDAVMNLQQQTRIRPS
jgi:hypothetical protein